MNKRAIEILRDPVALIDGWKCPICKNEFRDQYSCSHGWSDVRKANDRFLESI